MREGSAQAQPRKAGVSSWHSQRDPYAQEDWMNKHLSVYQQRPGCIFLCVRNPQQEADSVLAEGDQKLRSHL